MMKNIKDLSKYADIEIINKCAAVAVLSAIKPAKTINPIKKSKSKSKEGAK